MASSTSMLRQFLFVAIWIAAASVRHLKDRVFDVESSDSTSHATPQKTKATIDFPGFGNGNKDALVILRGVPDPFPGCTQESDSDWMVCPIRRGTQVQWLLQLQASGTGVSDQRNSDYSLALVYVQHEIKGAERNVVLMFKGYATAAEQFFVGASDAMDVERFLKDNPHGFDEYKPPEDSVVSTQCPARKASNSCYAPGFHGRCGDYYDCERPGSGNGPWSCHICTDRGASGCQPSEIRCMAPGGGSAGRFCPAYGKVEGGCEKAPKNTYCDDKYECTANGCAMCTTRMIETGRIIVKEMAHGPKYKEEEKIQDGCEARTDESAACAEQGT